MGTTNDQQEIQNRTNNDSMDGEANSYNAPALLEYGHLQQLIRDFGGTGSDEETGGSENP